MSNASLYEEAQLLARITVLEHVVALMVRESLVKAGGRAEHILAIGEKVKAHLTDRTPSGATAKQLTEAADQFFTAIASDIGSQGSQ